MVEKDLLDLETRRKIYRLILKSPGLHLRKLARELDIPLSTLDYHLYSLYKKGLITVRSGDRYTRYYVAGKIGIKSKEMMAVLRQRVPRKILIFLLIHPYSKHKDICNFIKLAPSTISFHLTKLINMDVIKRTITGREAMYNIKEPDHISRLIITYKKSFLDDAVDRFVDTWLELNPTNARKSKEKK